jgi:cytochrome bd-type quinol oxidase subunit 1
MERFKNLTTERKMPVSLFLSPAQKNNLFNGIDIKLGTKNMFINNNSNNKIKLINLLMYKKDKEENKIKTCIEKFLDFKSLLLLSSTNRTFYRNVRFFLFKYVYNKSIGPNTNRNEQKAFISKIILSLFKYCSIKKKTKKELKYLYSSYKTKSKYDMEITKDLTRTFPKDKSFSKDSKNSQKLYNVLTCYSNYNKSIGYAQGINFMAAIAICMFDKEEISFMFLDSLINRFELNNYLSINNKNLIGKLSHFSKYLNKYIPDIISFLDKHDINHGFFSHGWILTLFSNSMKKEYLIYTWAFMIIFGWKFFYSFVIQILLWYKKDIFKSNINLLCSKMKNILSDDEFGKNYKNIIRNTFSFMNKNIAL